MRNRVRDLVSDLGETELEKRKRFRFYFFVYKGKGRARMGVVIAICTFYEIQTSFFSKVIKIPPISKPFPVLFVSIFHVKIQIRVILHRICIERERERESFLV